MMVRKSIFAIVLALFCLALLVIPQRMDIRPLFAGAVYYQFYAGSTSSNAEIIGASAEDAARVKRSVRSLTGESARYENGAEALAQAEQWGAMFLFSHRAADVTDYYYYSPQLGGGVWLEGQLVNLHISLRGGSGCVGTPLIFGGY